MIKIKGNLDKFYSVEEYYNYFKTLLKEDNINILYEPIFKSKILFDYLRDNNLIDFTYLEVIKQKFGEFYIGEKNNYAIFDANLLIEFIYKRETLSGYTRQDIEDFFLYHISNILSTQSKNDYSRNCVNCVDIETKYGNKEEIEIYPIPQKIKEIKLIYFNKDSILEKLEVLEELSSDKNILKIIENIRNQLI